MSGKLSCTVLRGESNGNIVFLPDSLLGRTEVTQRFLRPIRSIHGKLSGLAFLDSSVTPLVDTIDRVLGQMPSKGKISGIHLEALRGICALLSDPAGMREHGQRVLAGESLIPPQQVSVASAFPSFWETESEQDVDEDPMDDKPDEASDPVIVQEPVSVIPKRLTESQRSIFL